MYTHLVACTVFMTWLKYTCMSIMRLEKSGYSSHGLVYHKVGIT
jgi:hypothetical protein